MCGLFSDLGPVVLAWSTKNHDSHTFLLVSCPFYGRLLGYCQTDAHESYKVSNNHPGLPSGTVRVVKRYGVVQHWELSSLQK